MIVAIFPDMTRDLTFTEVAYEASRTSMPTMHCENQTEIVMALRTIHGVKIAMQLSVK